MGKLQDIFLNSKKEDFPILTHNIHPYPAKYPPHIPNLIINNYAKKDYVIMDPFMGSGTTILEANFLNYFAVGNDINPLSPYIVKCKTTKLQENDIELLNELARHIEFSYENKEEISLIDWKGVDKWFKPNILYEISLIKQIMLQDKYINLNWFTTIVYSSIIVTVSNQDNDIRYCSHVKTANDVDGYAIKQFLNKLKKYIKDNQLLDKSYENHKLINNNALTLESVEDDSIDLLITSPPYANTNDYFLNSRLRLLCLDLDYDYYRKNEIGSHAQFSSKKANISFWNFDLLTMLKTFNRVLKKGSDAFIVIGDTVWKSDLYLIDQVIIDHCKESNFIFKDIYSYNLKSISKSFNPMFPNQTHMKKEHIIHLHKEG
jgi:DNA modification methylase